MGDPTAEETRNRTKRARRLAPPPSDDDDVVDRISGLGDDVLLRVLELVGDARDAVRTGALSRRWLGLWKRVPALRFASRSVWEFSDAQEWAALRRYVSSVNNALVLRSQSGCAVESLAISYTTHPPHADDHPDEYHGDMPAASVDAAAFRDGILGVTDPDGERYLERLMPASVDAIQGWICYAFRHGVRSFSVDMRLPYFWTYFTYHGRPADTMAWARDGDDEYYVYEPTVFLADVLHATSTPPPVRLEAMRLALGGARLRLLPTAMEFTSLTDLSLEWIVMEAGSVHLLSRLLSSASCPRLQKLRMRKLLCLDALDEETMLLEADVLSELQIQDVKFLSLKLKTPSLKIFHLHQPWHQPLTLSAPKLEELEMSFPQGSRLGWLEVDGDLPCVQRLKICMKSHRARAICDGEAEAEIDTNVQLLKRCTSLTRLDVTLTAGSEPFKEWDVDIIKSRVPHLPHITSLSVNISPRLGRHGYGASVANLLTRFDSLKRLSLHLPFFKSLDNKTTTGLDLLCDHQYRWKYNEFSMAHLREVELTGLSGTNCELWFMKAILARAKRLHKVVISFNPNCWQHEGNMDAFECILLDEGIWTPHRDAFTLTCVKCGLV